MTPSRDQDSCRDRLALQQRALAETLTGLTGNKTGVASNANGDASLLSGIDPAEIARSAETLIRKRIAQTRSALPGTARILGSDFPGAFREFAEEHFFHGTDAIWRDAIEFTRWLRSRRAEPAWLSDTLRWEYERCMWETHRYYLSCFRMKFAVPAWISRIDQPSPERRVQWILVWRCDRKGRIDIFSPPF
jgi:hypothetical protein